MLAPLGVAAGTVRRGGETAKGYRAVALADDFARYLTPSPSVTPSQPAVSAAVGGVPSVTPAPNVTDATRQNSANSAGRDVVTFLKPPSEPNGDGGDSYEWEAPL
jgi:hypothetical protein